MAAAARWAARAVKLWPTLVLLRDGVEVTRLVRPTSTSVIEEALEQLVGEG